MIAHVIVTYAGMRRSNNNPSITDAEKVKRLLKYHVETFERIAMKGKHKVDLLIVNNDSGDEEIKNFIENLNGRIYSWGKIISWTRPNLGFSFGGYKEAYEKYKSDYKYWSFAEDDCILTENVFEECVDFIEKYSAHWPLWISFSPVTFNYKNMEPHSGGGFGFTNSDSLAMQKWEDDLYTLSPEKIKKPYPQPGLGLLEIDFTKGFELRHLDQRQPFAMNWKDHPGHRHWRIIYSEKDQYGWAKNPKWNRFVKDSFSFFYRIGLP